MSKLNEIIFDGIVYNLVCFWRESKSDNSRDCKGKKFRCSTLTITLYHQFAIEMFFLLFAVKILC